jgi:hypothetical protein
MILLHQNQETLLPRSDLIVKDSMLQDPFMLVTRPESNAGTSDLDVGPV